MRLSEATTHFTRQLAANGCSLHTQRAYERDLRAFAHWLGRDVALSAITPDDLARFLTSDAVLLSPTGRPRAAISVNRTKSALRSFFVFCVESGLLRENPARLIRSSPAAVKAPSVLTEGEIRQLREVVGGNGSPLAHRDGLIFELLLGTGIRLGSLVALNAGDVDLHSGTLRIRLKGGTEGRVFLNPGLRRLLGRYLKENAPQGACGRDTPLFRASPPYSRRASTGRRLGTRQIQLRFAALCRECKGRSKSVPSGGGKVYHPGSKVAL